MKTSLKTSTLLIGSLSIIAFSSCASTTQSSKLPTSAPTKKCGTSAKIKPYPLDTCMVIGAKLSSTPKTYTRIHDGQEVKFCCISCIKAFEANPDIFLAKLR